MPVFDIELRMQDIRINKEKKIDCQNQFWWVNFTAK